MKAGLTLRTCVLTVAVLLVKVAQADVSRPEFIVPYVDTLLHPFSIDGQGEDWHPEVFGQGINFYKGDGHLGSSTSYGTTVLGTMSDRADGEVMFYLTHDGSYLYVLAIVNDDLLEQRSGENNSNEAWREDALQLCFASHGIGQSDDWC